MKYYLKDNVLLKEKAVAGFVWKFFEKAGVQFIQVVLQLILARLLAPSDYGEIAILTVFISLSDVFIAQGLTTGLIQKKTIDELDYSSVYWANILLSCLLYLCMWLIAPKVALFYGNERLKMILRVLSINIIIGAFGSVHNAFLSRKMEFQKSFARNLTNVIVQGIVGIILAVKGFGVWSLVFSKLLGNVVGTAVMCITVQWNPQCLFSFKRVRNIFEYSVKILGTNLINTLFNNMHTIIIGKFYDDTTLGHYQRGQQIPQAAMLAIDGSLEEVLYTTLSKCQDNIEELKRVLRRTMKMSYFLIAPMMIGLATITPALIRVLLTEKWVECIPFMQLSCIICLFWPMSARIHAINAIGKSNVTFKISVISKIITLCLILVCVPMGIYAIMYGTILASIVSMCIVSYYVKKYIYYSGIELIRDLVPTLASTFIMGMIVYLIGYLFSNDLLKLIVQVLCGFVMYIIMAQLSKNDSYVYILSYLKNKKCK